MYIWICALTYQMDGFNEDIDYPPPALPASLMKIDDERFTCYLTNVMLCLYLFVVCICRVCVFFILFFICAQHSIKTYLFQRVDKITNHFSLMLELKFLSEKKIFKKCENVPQCSQWQKSHLINFKCFCIGKQVNQQTMFFMFKHFSV